MLSRLFLLVLILPAFAWAALDESEVQATLAGRYRLETEIGTVSFLIRSRGTVEILNKDGEFKYASGSISYSYSKSSDLHDGLPIANLVIGTGSDEDAQDFHVVLAVEQGEESNAIKVLATFSTFNDGPNGYSMAEAVRMKLSKFDKESDKFLALD